MNVMPEMLEAGVEMFAECREQGLGDAETCLAIYNAMEAIRAIAEVKAGAVH